MKGAIYFRVLTGYIQTGFEKMRKLSDNYYWDKGAHKGVWTFHISKLPKVAQLLGEAIEFSPAEVQTLLDYSPALREALTLPQWKGKDKIKIIEYPEIFVVIEHRKVVVEGEVKIKTMPHEIPRENVINAWEVIKKQPMGTPVKTSTVAKNIVERLGIDRFNRRTGTFDFQKFFGARRDYYNYFYLPVKVLQYYYEVVKHHKSGKIEKVDEVIIDQARFRK